MDTTPKQWKTIVEEVVREAKQIPLWGTPPPFAWDSFNNTLKERLGATDFEAQIVRTDWVAPGAWREGMGIKPIVLSVESLPLQGRCFWVLSEEEMRENSLKLLSSTSNLSDHTKESPLAFLKGFYRYLSLHALDALALTNSFPGLRFTLSSDENVPNTPMLTMQVAIICKGIKTFAKILVPNQTLASFREFFRTVGRPPLTQEMASRIDVSIAVVIGSAKLKSTAWKSIHVGDFLVLDNCQYNPSKKSGKACLMLDAKPLASCSIKQGRLHVEDRHSYEEEIMEPENPSDEPEEDFSSFDESDENDQQFDEEEFQEDFDETQHEEDVEEEAESLSEEVEAGHEAPALGREIPITLSVEVTRLRMGLDKVLALQPGNIIDLSVSVEQGVTLLVGGKAVARGELIQLGEALGVKITELG